MSSSTSNVPTLYQVDKLNNHNFTTWKFRLQMILKARKLWKYVDPGVVGLDAENQEKDQEALSQIALTVSDGVIGHIRNAKTAREAAIAASKDQEAARSLVALSKDQLQKAKESFNVRLAQTQMSEQDYRAIKPFIGWRNKLGGAVISIDAGYGCSLHGLIAVLILGSDHFTAQIGISNSIGGFINPYL